MRDTHDPEATASDLHRHRKHHHCNPLLDARPGTYSSCMGQGLHFISVGLCFVNGRTRMYDTRFNPEFACLRTLLTRRLSKPLHVSMGESVQSPARRMPLCCHGVLIRDSNRCGYVKAQQGHPVEPQRNFLMSKDEAW